MLIILLLDGEFDLEESDVDWASNGLQTGGAQYIWRRAFNTYNVRLRQKRARKMMRRVPISWRE